MGWRADFRPDTPVGVYSVSITATTGILGDTIGECPGPPRRLYDDEFSGIFLFRLKSSVPRQGCPRPGSRLGDVSRSSGLANGGNITWVTEHIIAREVNNG